MSRRPVLVFVAAAALAQVGLAAPVHAEPAEPAAPPCDFRLSAPLVVHLSGTNVVTATVEPAGCGVAAQVTLSIACVQMQGSESAEQCSQTSGPGTASVYFAPYRPGATYVATGRGCASVGNPPRSICQTTGPLTATL